MEVRVNVRLVLGRFRDNNKFGIIAAATPEDLKRDPNFFEEIMIDAAQDYSRVAEVDVLISTDMIERVMAIPTLIGRVANEGTTG